MTANTKRETQLKNIVRWARQIPDALGKIHAQYGAHVHLRPTSNGVTMLGLTPGRPQRGTGGLRDLEAVVQDFERLFAEHCVPEGQGRDTPEKELQSALIRDAYENGGRMSLLGAATAGTSDEVVPIFLTDEIVMPTDAGGRILCDLLAVRPLDDRSFRPIVIELKSERQLKRLTEQVESYALLVEEQLAGFEALASALLAQDARLVCPCERWIVWPDARPGEPDPREAELAQLGIRVVTYLAEGGVFRLRAGAGR